jgi:hypothetical protein
VRSILLAALVALLVLRVQMPVGGQPQLRKQLAENTAAEPMSAPELAELGDPMFLLVLKDQAQEVRLDEIEKLIAGDTGQRSLFVVDERLQSSTRGETRRAVTAFKGANKGVRLDPNIGLSMIFDDRGFRPGFIEAWGWDDARSRYNYYRLDGTPATWKFRGSSVDADKLALAQRQGTCMACHINGAPVMKELPFPWNNWHSFRNSVNYLSPAAADHWQIAESPRFRDLRGAEALETGFILPSIRQFNGRRLSRLVQTAPTGEQRVTDGRRALQPLFRTTEYNIISAGDVSGSHPIGQSVASSDPIAVPDTFFLNANLLAGGGISQYEGLGIPEARQFATVLRIQPAEYKGVVTKSGTSIGGLAGDTHFAWFVPEASHVDNQMIDLLIRRGVVTRDFAAAVMAVDVETPAFSSARERLLTLIPDAFAFKPLAAGDVPAAHPDQLTRDVIARLRALPPSPGSPEAEFLALLENPNPVGALRARVTTYLTRVSARLGDPQQRPAEIERLYRAMLDRRQRAVAQNPTLVESRFLFPEGR